MKEVRLIDANKMIKDIKENYVIYGYADFLNDFFRMVEEQPTVDAEPIRHGHWEWDEDGMDWNIGAWKCSECRSTAEAWWAGAKNANPYHCSGHRYCSNCGAKMDGEK